MSVPVKGFLKRRRDRIVGSILGFAERELYRDLTPEQQKGLRETVLAAVNGYHDAVLDLMGAETDVVRNDKVIELLEELQGRRDRATVQQPA